MTTPRDTCTDSGRMGDGSNVQRADRYTGPMDFSPTTIEEQADLGGYNRTDIPVGGQRPMQKTTVGLRGEADYVAAKNEGHPG